MTAGLASNMKVYQNYIPGRVNELLTQQGNVFNDASRGAIQLTNASMRGDYQYTSLFSNISGLAARRDTTSVSGQSDTNLAQAESINVKLNRKFIPIAQTRDAFRKAFGQYSEIEFADIVAEQAANAMQIEMCDSALLGVRAALKQQSTSYYTESSLGSISTQTLVQALAKMGDRADRVVCWVMHSKPFYDLLSSQVSANITGVSNFAIASATPVTLNRPVLVTDSASLVSQLNSPDVNNYFTLGLTAGAVTVENTEEQEIVIQDVTGLENLVVRFQGEYAYNLGVKGFQWNVSSGGANPTSTNVALGTYWTSVLGSVKDRSGVVAMTL
jgi:hypothetical protein